jgi:predicted nucleic acid-binding protein
MSETENLAPLCFIDTNIWLYAFIASQDATKSTRAKQLLQENAASIVVSSQTVNDQLTIHNPFAATISSFR